MYAGEVLHRQVPDVKWLCTFSTHLAWPDLQSEQRGSAPTHTHKQDIKQTTWNVPEERNSGAAYAPFKNRINIALVVGTNIHTHFKKQWHFSRLAATGSETLLGRTLKDLSPGYSRKELSRTDSGNTFSTLVSRAWRKGDKGMPCCWREAEQNGTGQQTSSGDELMSCPHHNVKPVTSRAHHPVLSPHVEHWPAESGTVPRQTAGLSEASLHTPEVKKERERDTQTQE